MIKEKGSAGFSADLTDGVISIKHCECDSVLAEWVAEEGDWSKLWDTIRTLQGGSNEQSI